jgi:spermidine/putrescine transport system substrate-binding protein
LETKALPMIAQRTNHKILSCLRACLLTSLLFSACITPPPALPPTTSAKPLAKELILYNWEEDLPQSVIDAFTKEYGIPVTYLVYEAQEDAIANMRAGEVYDVVVMESRFIPLLAQEGLLAELHKENLSNLRNISANFRELAYDPTNQYSVPYNWGSTGLVVRSDLVEKPITRWADLWDPRYTGRVGLWMRERREVIGLTLKSLGYSANSENREELEKALGRLLELKPHVIALEDYDLNNSADAMTSGAVVISMGYAADIMNGKQQNEAITYVLPEEGALLWNDTFVIPANSQNQYSAELFLNFLMRPDINAMIANENRYATPNEAALPLIEPEIRNNPVVFPPNEDLINAELILPLSVEVQILYDQIWEEFTSGL